MKHPAKRQKVALVLSSGGARGLAHIGVIRELEKNGFEISSIAGSSVGSLIGGIYLSGKLGEFAEWICDLDQIDVFDLMDFTLTTHGFIKGDKLFAKLRGFLSDKNIEDHPIPYVAVAADLRTRKEVLLRSGSLTDAIRASVSIPTIVTPVFREEYILVDGGTVNPIPADVIARTPGDLLFVSDINARKPYRKPNVEDKPLKEHPFSLKRGIFKFVKYNTSIFSSESPTDTPPGYLDVIDKTFDIMQDSICALTKQNYHPDILVEISRDAATTFEFHRATELIEAGRLAFYEAMDQWKG